MLPEYPGWLTEMAEYARFVLDPLQAEKWWLDNSANTTSIFNPYELVGQVLIDMGAVEAVNTLSPQLQNMPALRDSLLDFITKVARVEDSLPDHPPELNINQFLHGTEWKNLKQSAMKLVQNLQEEGIIN